MQVQELASAIDPHLTADLRGKGASVIELWRAAAHGRVDGTVEAAAQFQRPSGRMKLPQNVCLVLTADEVVAFKFNPRNLTHPLEVTPRQVGKELERWPRSAVRVTAVDPKGMTSKATFEIEGAEQGMRCPPLAKNPAAAAVIVALGGSLDGSPS
ncbi:hypothetical protein HJD18_05330 [Thermoleophilia bacterium SCSIO 60948]|nr:hypothetical protein HJD18_05330 [Thermoleophilia bacterium SCSIO 60948]